MEDCITVEDVNISSLFGENDPMDTTDDALLQTPKAETGAKPKRGRGRKPKETKGTPEVEIILPSGKPIEPVAPVDPGKVEIARPPPAVSAVETQAVTIPDSGFFRLKDDCSNVPRVGNILPRAVLYKNHNITDPTRVSLALSFARNYQRVPASILGDAATFGQLAKKVEESLNTPEATQAQGKRASHAAGSEGSGVKRPRVRRRPKATPKKPPSHLAADARLIARNRELEGQVAREKAVNHQAHTEVNRLNRELGKEKAENARLNADLIRIRAERDDLKKQVASGKHLTYPIWP